MRAIDVENLKEGIKLARTIYDDSGRVLLSRGSILTRRYIEKLIMYGIPFVYVEDEIIGPLEVEELIDDRVRLETVKALKNVVSSARMQSDVDIKPVSSMVNKILDDLKNVNRLIVQLMDIRNPNMYVYNHSVSVCVLSILTGMALGLDELKIKTLGMGAILHDIGKSLSLGPEHTVHGFEILRNSSNLNIVAAHIAFQHHERFDGTGYPRQLNGDEIHLFAAITSIADMYDNLVSNMIPEKRLYPYQALEQIVAETGHAFQKDIVQAFCRNIAPYPVGTTVRLNNGAVGVVIAVSRNFPTRPVVKLVTNNVGILLKDFPEVDLMTEVSLFVTDILDERERQNLTHI